MRTRIQRPSPALVISLIALFVALGGTGYAAVKINGKNIKNKTIAGAKLKNKTITAGKVKNNTLTGTQINETRLGKVPSAGKADSAVNATQLDGKGASSFATAKAEPVRIVGAPGQPPFQGTWGVGGSEQVPGFWKDPFGTVYLQGQAGRTGADSVIFTLPEGYRPTENSYFSTYPSAGDGTAAIAVRANGEVALFNLDDPNDDNFVGLGGIVFRAAGS